MLFLVYLDVQFKIIDTIYNENEIKKILIEDPVSLFLVNFQALLFVSSVNYLKSFLYIVFLFLIFTYINLIFV